jgi:uncharacterized protein (DUF362 family)/Pyruvate/2-oxoacid:ferredoxin oxidoreductase delta subunit
MKSRVCDCKPFYFFPQCPYNIKMSKVFLKKASYDYKTLKPAVYELLDATSGSLIKKNSRVMIKPNLLAPASPDKAILTHPLLIRASVEYLIQKGARPRISDSPAMGSLDKVMRESGIQEALRGLNVEFREFRQSVVIDVGPPFHNIEIAEDAINTDIIINMPKLKTHTQMLLSLGVKNLFGCIVGMKKPEWHFRTGIDREIFAKLLVQIYRAVSPSVTIIDAVLAMEGQGPGRSGSPKHLGLLMGSSDTVALDITICRMLGIDPDRLLTNKTAKEMGLVQKDITVEGDIPDIKNFRLPEITPLVFGPERLHGFMRRHLVQRPVADNSLCEQCGECWNYCHAQAITPGKKKLHFDYDRCIRCYCCIEVCPHGALSARETSTGRILRKVLRKKLEK